LPKFTPPHLQACPISLQRFFRALEEEKKKMKNDKIRKQDGQERRIGEPFQDGKVHLGRYGGNAP
jgi:hypothetical protein